MEIFSIIWTFIIAYFGCSTSIDALEFGMCEVRVPMLVVTNFTTPYWVQKTIQGCCKGFIKKRDNSCEPDCRNVHCVNSYCIGNDTCKCNKGYYPIDNYKCLPTCDPPCASDMACIEPNMCMCKQDYKKFNATHCEPICSFTEEDFECINAKCFAPNKCQCHEGFYPVSEFQCEPICHNCKHGECVAPNQCDCHDGYEKNSEGNCVPFCHPNCINSDCIQPNVCRCHDNYEKYLRPNECLERHVIRDREDCVRTCIDGSCNSNGTCICNYGYEMFNGKCLKICNKKCVSGKCLEDQCVCPTDYRLAYDNSTCLPVCAFEDGHDCINGDCVAPNMCECYNGYKFLDDRNCTCVPMCEPMCINSICTEHGCICHDGFYNISAYECIKNCIEGFMWLHDECVENFDFNFDEIEITTEEETTTTTTILSQYDEMTEVEDEIILSTTESLCRQEESSTWTLSTTEYKEEILTTTEDNLTIVDDYNEKEDIEVEWNEEQKIEMISIIVVLSVTLLLLICILITFYVLYNHIFPKQIYFVRQKEQSANCVYFTKQPDRQAPLPYTEFNI